MLIVTQHFDGKISVRLAITCQEEPSCRNIHHKIAVWWPENCFLLGHDLGPRSRRATPSKCWILSAEVPRPRSARLGRRNQRLCHTTWTDVARSLQAPTHPRFSVFTLSKVGYTWRAAARTLKYICQVVVGGWCAQNRTRKVEPPHVPPIRSI